MTGPTGSGKTTTLYSAIRLIQGEGVNIVTVEDPVEYRLGANIVQVQVHEKAGLTFASALRSILRQDPDVVLIGEIRDQETAQIALQASLTGHLVLSTLHTNDAPNAVTRLVDMGMEAYKIASALRGVVAQRLMRRLCPACAEVSNGAGAGAGGPVRPRRQRRSIRRSAAPSARMTGYRGRFSIIEVLTMNPELERRIGEGATADQIAESGAGYGMRSLWESGLRHVLAGESTWMSCCGSPTCRGPRLSEPEESAPPARPPRPHRAGRPGRRRPVATASPPPAAPSARFRHGPGAARRAGAPWRAGSRPASGEFRVLLVEDEEHAPPGHEGPARAGGLHGPEARDGVQALDQVDRHAPDIIMLDLNLPGPRRLQRAVAAPLAPGHPGHPGHGPHRQGRRGQRGAVFELGADDFLTKPFRARALTARLEAVLGRRRA